MADTEPNSNHDGDKNNKNSAMESAQDILTKVLALYHQCVTPENIQKLKIPSIVLFVAIAATGNLQVVFLRVVYPIYWLILRVIASAIGVALGLGFAAHVYDQLEYWAGQNRKNPKQDSKDSTLMDHLVGGRGKDSAAKKLTKIAPSTGGTARVDLLNDSGYAALMSSAGYDVDTNWKRGQVVRQGLPIAYPFCDTKTVEQQYAVQVMTLEWPTLPPQISKEIGKFMEYVMRDFVATWYSLMDAGIPYPEVVQREKDKAAAKERGEEWIEPLPAPPPGPSPFPRKMVFSTASTRALPVLENIYRSMSVMMGNLAHRVKDVNAFRLVLLKWVKVIAHTFKVYRQLRKAILDKQDAHKDDKSGIGVGRVVRGVAKSIKSTSSSISQIVEESMADEPSTNSAGDTVSEEGNEVRPNPSYQQVSEMAITREFLVTGKLHPACTFGLEVPSLLFSDPSGKDCGTGVEGQDPKALEEKTEDEILEERLYKTRLLEECEIDYNRVLASRIVKLLLPRQDHGSPIVASLLTEILGACVLAPSMSCFSPDYLNDWIRKGIQIATETGEYAPVQPESASAVSTPVGADGQPIMRDWDDFGDNNNEDVTNERRLRSFSDEGEGIALEDAFDQEGQQELSDLMDLSANEIDYSELSKQAAEELLGTGSEIEDEEEKPKPTDAEDDEDDDSEEDDILLEEETNAAGVYHMISLLAEALMNLQRQLDLEDCRQNSQGGSGVEVAWDNPNCKKAVLRLVLVVEALLLHGRRLKPIPIEVSKPEGSEDAEEKEDELVEEEFNSGNFTQVLMDLTSDIEAFEKMHVKAEDTAEGEAGVEASEGVSEGGDSKEEYVPTPNDLSTLRTLIAAWLHTGNIFNTLATLVKAKTTVLRPFYHPHAFLRNPQTSQALLRQLKTLDGIDVMVDTVAILNSPRIDPQADLMASFGDGQGGSSATPTESAKGNPVVGQMSGKKKFGFKGLLDKGRQNLNDKKKAIGDSINKDIGALKGSLKGRNPLGRGQGTEDSMRASQSAFATSSREVSSSSVDLSQGIPPAMPGGVSTGLPGSLPRYLDFHRNEAFASSLRSERDRRMQAWVTSIQNDTEMIQIVCRVKGATPEDTVFHRELHHCARIFYAGTNILALRDAARSGGMKNRARLNTADSGQSITSTGSDAQSPEVSLLTVEMACPRRRIEVPDDDSSFLLRAQPRALNSMGVHRDTRNADQSYRGFAASFEEPAIVGNNTRYKPGRYIRRCQLRYYPSDRTASIVLLNDTRKLDQRKGKSNAPDRHHGRQIATKSSSIPFLPPEFMRERHLCQKWIPKGSTSRSQPGLMSSTVMEQADFTAAPRTGKALDFVYRMSLFESPMIELGGKRFTVHDSSAGQGAHKADASALEMSDAALSAALLVCGRDYNAGLQTDDASVGNTRNKVELGPDGYPIIWMKYTRKMNDGTSATEIKPYRTSFIRAALLITSTRQEAQLQCLIKCVKAGSAKSATKARTDAQLRPTLRLLDFARDRSREKQEKLLRDLKLGINHIDREQLRRNALLSPRFPTRLLSVQVSIEKAMPAKDATVLVPGNPQSTVFKIRCVATVGLVSEDVPDELLEPYKTDDGKLALTYMESWAVFRPFRDFQTLHKHLKSQVAATESSGNAGTRLVGAAAAAFNAGAANQGPRSRQRNAMIPSLGQANKAGALGVTQRSITKRMEILDGYLHHILSQGHQLSRSPELLMFIGAFFPLSSEVKIGHPPISMINDPLGRAEMSREALTFASEIPAEPFSEKQEMPAGSSHAATAGQSSSLASTQSKPSALTVDTPDEISEDALRAEKLVMTNPGIVNKINKVPLGQVRNRLFELLTHQFGFENASFFRGQMLSAIKTMSFAVTTPGEFRKTLYKAHLEYISADALAYWINYGIETLWPGGVFFESKPALTPKEQKEQADLSRTLLHQYFPDQLRTVLGGQLTRDGLDMLHEMLQNRMVMKSMFYMLFELLYEEAFPEMKDILSCGEALDINFEEEE